MNNNTSVIMLDTSLIIPNKYQPRKIFEDDALNSLAESIKTYGIINPILVRKKDNKYEIIAGERRFRAAKEIGLTEVPVIVKNADEQQMAELALIENIQRQGLSPIEEAKSYEEIMRIGNQTQASLAEKIGKSQSAIANKIRLLSLPQEIQNALANKKISERHARSLITIEDNEKQLELLNRIMTEKLTVKETEEIIKQDANKDEEEIKQAISDILKSLNIKEEEKEDDNMNNGNFFPNFDNNNNSNNNTSLNMMNMQSLNQPAMQPVPEVVMPTMMPVQEPIVQQPLMQPQIQTPETPVNIPPMYDQNSQNMVNTSTPDTGINNNLNPIPDFMLPQDNLGTAPMNNIEQPMINNSPLFNVEAPVMEQNVPTQEPQTPNSMVDVPLFNPNVTMPNTESILVPTIENTTINEEQPLPMQQEPQTPNSMVDVPLFNPNATMPIQEPTAVEIPVTTPVEINQETVEEQVMDIPAVQDRLKEVTEFLMANGYVFKTFSNETDNCIIIEIPKN